MTASLEMSLYPLEENYKEIILNFIGKVKLKKNLEVIVNNFSTQVYGSYDDIMDLLANELREVLKQQPSIAVIKLAAKDLR